MQEEKKPSSVEEIEAVPELALKLLALALMVAKGDAPEEKLTEKILRVRTMIKPKVRQESKQRARSMRQGMVGIKKLIIQNLKDTVAENIEEAAEGVKTAAPIVVGTPEEAQALNQRGPIVEVLLDIALAILDGEDSLIPVARRLLQGIPNPMAQRLVGVASDIEVDEGSLAELAEGEEDLKDLPELKQWWAKVSPLINRIVVMLSTKYRALPNTVVNREVAVVEGEEKVAASLPSREEMLGLVKGLLEVVAKAVSQDPKVRNIFSKAQMDLPNKDILKALLDKGLGNEALSMLEQPLRSLVFKGVQAVTGVRSPVGGMSLAKVAGTITPEDAQNPDERVEITKCASVMEFTTDPIQMYKIREEDLSSQRLPSNLHHELISLLGRTAGPQEVGFGPGSDGESEDPFGSVM